MVRHRLLLTFLACAPLPALAQPVQPVQAEIMPLSELKSGQRGEVWTVFQGTKPEPFTVEVTGIIQNALGPGKSIILCKLTDPRVQNMGAVAGMSGSPLYIDGKFAGALSYQIQRFETVRYAGFTPAADMAEVAERVGALPADPALMEAAPAPDGARSADSAFRAMNPVFAISGLSPQAAAIMAPQFSTLGIDVVAMGGSSQGQNQAGGAGPAPALKPGDAVSVALSTGDILLAGTGTVSRVEGSKVVAFGHPMLSMGDVQMPMCSAEVVAILPSTLESVKIANVGPVIGCISEDRLSAVSGLLGAGPEMTDVEVVCGRGPAPRTIHFQVVRDRRIAPMIMLSGIVEAVFGSNDAEPGEGFRISTTVTFSPTQQITRDAVYAGQQGFNAGIMEFLIGLNAALQNPFEKAVAKRVEFHVDRLESNPSVTVEQFQLSRTVVRPGDSLEATLSWRDYEGAAQTTTIEIPVDPSWIGRTLEIVAAPGRILDELTGHGHYFRPGQIRSFDAYLDALKDNRPEDGLCVAVVEKSALFFDQAQPMPDAPASIERIAAAADSSRYQRREALVPLWETHVLAGKASYASFHKTVRVVE
jgi:hypothetical protein